MKEVPLSIGLSDYGGFDAVSGGDLAELSKALEAGQLQGGAIGNSDQTNSGALKVESLESSLKMLEFRESDIRLWKKFPKSAAYNTVEEFNQLTSYGADRGGFNNEGELPEEEDSEYLRRAEHVKFLGVTKSVTHPMELVTTKIGSLIQRETTNGILWILRKANKGLFFGDDKVVRQEYNGIYSQHMNNENYSTLNEYMASPLVVDLRGKTMKEQTINGACEVLINQFAQPNFLIAPPVVLSDFAENYYARQRMLVGSNTGNNNNGVIGGTYVPGFQSQYGKIDFEYDIFATKGQGRLGNSVQTSPKAPTAPVYVGAVVVNDDTSSRFDDSIGDVRYAVSAINRYGESSLMLVPAVVTITNVTDSVDLEFTAGVGAYTPNAYIVYRSQTGAQGAAATTMFYPIMTVPVTGSDAKRGSLANGVDGAAVGKVRDRNRYLPGTENAYLTQHDTDVYEFKQLAPLMKMDLAILGPARRFMVLLYGTPIVYAPGKIIRFINIGRKDRVVA